jgi:hypothetical protein
MKNIVILIMICLPVYAFSQSKNELKKQIKKLEILKKELSDSLDAHKNKYINLLEKKIMPSVNDSDANDLNDSLVISKLNYKIDSLQKQLAANNKSNPQLEKSINENKQLKDSILTLNKEIEPLKDEIYDLKQEKGKTDETNKEKDVKILAKDNEIQKLKADIQNLKAGINENEALKNMLFDTINTHVNRILNSADFTSQRPNIEKLNADIEQLKNVNPQFVNSLTAYSSKLEWYKNMTNAIENSKKTLDEKYETAKVTEAYLKLEAVQNSVISKPTVAQNTIIETQKTLLKDYCGKYYYVANKMNDANYFGADKVGALEEIDAALKRTDKNYSFLIKKLEERKKNPTNKTLTLEKVPCP